MAQYFWTKIKIRKDIKKKMKDVKEIIIDGEKFVRESDVLSVNGIKFVPKFISFDSNANPKDIRFEVRLTEHHNKMLKDCANHFKCSNAEAVRIGIDLLHSVLNSECIE